MSLAAQLSALSQRIAAEIKDLVRPEHPGLARAWITFGYENNQIVIRGAHNVAGVTRLAAGRYRVIFATPMPDANYCWLAFARNAGSDKSLKIAAARATAETKTAMHVELICATASGTLSDTSELNIVVYR